MTTIEAVWVWNENCTLAGREVSQGDLEKYHDPSECWDWHSEEVSLENLESLTAPGRGLYNMRIARVVREALVFNGVLDEMDEDEEGDDAEGE